MNWLKTEWNAATAVCVSKNLISSKSKRDAALMCGLPAVCPVPHRSVWSKGVSKWLPVSSLLYPSRTKLLMENWTPLQFLALCRLNNPFHLLFIPLAPLTWAVILLWRDAECWSCAYRGYRGLSEESSCALCRSSVAQQILKKHWACSQLSTGNFPCFRKSLACYVFSRML